MPKMTTGHLTDVLLHPGEAAFSRCLADYPDAFESPDFPTYYKRLLAEKGIRNSDALFKSGLEVHYGYQILRGLKKPSRDKVLCLCVGGTLTLAETQRALNAASLGPLYPRRPREAVIMLALNGGVDRVWTLNAKLAEHGLPLLS